MKKRVVCLFLALSLLLGSALSLASCAESEANKNQNVQPCQHEDINSDGRCDECGARLSSFGQKPNENEPCTSHDDKDHDGICDNKGCHAVVPVNHVDLGRDGLCDICGQQTGEKCENHSDTDHDGVCDSDGCIETLEVIHVDQNEDFLCDVCGSLATDCENEKHFDGDHNGICDNVLCQKDLPVFHSDDDGNGYCDVCYCELICEHVDEDGDFECDLCGKYFVDCENGYHIDEDGDFWCDECDTLLEEETEDDVINYPWSNQTLIFQMTHNTQNEELPSACERYLAGEDLSASEYIDTKVIERNAMAEYITKVDVRYEYYPNTAEYGWGNNISRIETTVKTDSTKDAPDMYCNFVYDMVGASLRASFANLYDRSRGQGDLKGLNYFEFLDMDYDESVDNKGYMLEYMQSLSLSQHKMYVLSSDYFLDMIRAFFIIPVSKTLLEEYGESITGDRDLDGEFTLDDFYEQVKAGEWTYDLLAQYCDKVYKASSSNTSGACWIGDDVIGFAVQTGGLAASGLMYSTSVTIIHKTWNDITNDWEYYYEPENSDLYTFCDNARKLFQSPGIVVVDGKNVSTWGSSALLAIRNRFAENHILFGDVMLVGALEFEQYQTMKEAGGFGIVPVPLYRSNSNDKYLALIHNVGRPGAISANSTKFVECTAFLNYQSTHSTDILNTYYDYKLQYDVAEGEKGTVYMLQYIRNNVRSAFDKTFEDVIGSFYSEQGADAQKWTGIFSSAKYQLDIRADYKTHYGAKKEHLDTLAEYFDDLP